VGAGHEWARCSWIVLWKAAQKEIETLLKKEEWDVCGQRAMDECLAGNVGIQLQALSKWINQNDGPLIPIRSTGQIMIIIT
jgi:hypothetical protein